MTQGNRLIRCGWCPGATAAIRLASRVPCQACAPHQRAACPWCGGLVLLDTNARRADDVTCTVAFCMACEFAIEIPMERISQ